MRFETRRYRGQRDTWPERGHHIMAQYDDEDILVYQAYRAEIADWAVEHQMLGGPAFSYDRMSWIKPNFLWMMYRSGWGTKRDQERTLGLRISRAFFEPLLSEAVPSSYWSELYETREDWKREMKGSEVRLQWDPDHDPAGGKVSRRAVQLGLRGETLRRFGQQEIVEVLDLTQFVREQRGVSRERLETPWERAWTPEDARVGERVRLET